ncbi:MAG: sulfotransferase family 2 domain-containing protein [Pseudomonadota bacterium]
MLDSENYKTKVLFHHIPKTAGTTLIAYLEQFFSISDTFPEEALGMLARDVRRSDIIANSEYISGFPLIHGHYAVTAFEPLAKGRVRFTFLREPSDRLLSLYNDWCTKSEESLATASAADRDTALAARSLSLVSFLSRTEWPVPALFDNAQVRLLSGRMDEPEIGKIALDEAIANLKAMDFIGLTEYFEISLSVLSSRLGLQRPEKVEPLNRAKRQKDLEKLSGQALLEVERCTRYDKLLYEYACKLFDRQVSLMLSKSVIDKKSTTQAIMPAPTQYRLTMDMGFSGAGWHVREGIDSKRPWRWTGPDTESCVAFRLANERDYLVTLHIVSVIDQAIVDDITLFVHNEALNIKWLGVNDGEQLIAAIIPARLLSSSGNELVIKVPYTVSHASVQPETEDYRQKGVAITEVRFEPLDASS